jgi:pimeloyl-ACP methyl ester carboxylesterase
MNMQARSSRLPPDMQAAFTGNLLAMSMPAYRRIWEEAVVFQLPDALRRVNNPTLVTAGSRESKIILQAVDAIPRIMPNALGRLAPGVGHGWNVEAPTLFNRMLRAWVSDAPLPAELLSVSSEIRQGAPDQSMERS